MADEINYDQPSASPPDILNEADDVLFRQVVRQKQGRGYIGLWQWVVHCIEHKGCASRPRGQSGDVDSNDLRSRC